jgi:hypothetical protein
LLKQQLLLLLPGSISRVKLVSNRQLIRLWDISWTETKLQVGVNQPKLLYCLCKQLQSTNSLLVLRNSCNRKTWALDQEESAYLLMMRELNQLILASLANLSLQKTGLRTCITGSSPNTRLTHVLQENRSD